MCQLCGSLLTACGSRLNVQGRFPGALASWPVSDCSQALSLSCATEGLQWTEQLQDEPPSGGACGPWVPAAARRHSQPAHCVPGCWPHCHAWWRERTASREEHLYIPSMGSVVASDVPRAITARRGAPETKMQIGNLLERSEAPWTVSCLLIWKVNSI